MPDGSRARSTRTSGHQPTSLPFARARKPDASRRVLGHEGEGDEADREERGDLVEQRPRDALDVGRPRELGRDPAQALELALPLRRAPAARRPARADLDRTTKPISKAERERADDRQRRSPTRARGRSGRGEATRLWSCWAWGVYGADAAPERVFQAADSLSLRVQKMGRPAHCGRSAARNSVPGTGRCEPRRAPGLAFRGEQLEKARRTDPPERRAFSSSRPSGAV